MLNLFSSHSHLILISSHLISSHSHLILSLCSVLRIKRSEEARFHTLKIDLLFRERLKTDAEEEGKEKDEKEEEERQKKENIGFCLSKFPLFDDRKNCYNNGEI